MGSQYIPDVPYADYAKLLGLTGIYCEKPKKVGDAWDQALSANRPVVVEFKVDQETPPLPPHIMKTQAKKAAKAWMKDQSASASRKRASGRRWSSFTRRSPAAADRPASRPATPAVIMQKRKTVSFVLRFVHVRAGHQG